MTILPPPIHVLLTGALGLIVLALPVPASSQLSVAKTPGRATGERNQDALLLMRATRKEALAIASLVPEGQQKVLLDFDVNYQTATSADLGEYRFVHFATHGLLDTQYPELSGILL